jgi:hypothetical protein
MENIKKVFDKTKKSYDAQEQPINGIRDTAIACIDTLQRLSPIAYGGCSGKEYSIFEDNKNKSRPFLEPLFIANINEFSLLWAELINSTNTKQHRFNLDEKKATRVIYSAVMSFSICYDLYKPKSRKTPGTFFEIILGTLLSILLPEAKRTKHITLPSINEVDLEDLLELDSSNSEEDENTDSSNASKVSTDIVFSLPNGKGIIIPAKITTRERIVQPFAHQRILDSALGSGRYISLITCVSETQRDDKKNSVNEICVPGTIALFQQHLAKIDGIFYLDPPPRYLSLSQAGIIDITSLGFLVTEGLDAIVTRLQTSPIVGQSR